MELDLEALSFAWHYSLMLIVVLFMLWRLADEARQRRELSKRQLLKRMPRTNRPSNRQL
jgi:hypothetical protein